MALERDIDSMDIRIRAEHRTFGRVLEGPPSLVLEDIDLADLRTLQISMGGAYGAETPSLAVRMSRKEGVQVEIRDEGADWIVVAATRLKNVILRQRPWYWWTRSYWIMYPVFALPLFVLVFWAFPPRTTNFSLYLAISIWISFVSGGCCWLWGKLIPGFELMRSGSRGRGTRIFATLGTLTLFVMGIVIPLLVTTGK
jgi:hypothetical protein